MVASLGIIMCTGTTNAVRATSQQRDPTARVAAQSVRFQARLGNSGVVYVGLKGMEGSPTVDSPQIIAILGIPPATGSFPEYTCSVPNAPAALNAADFYLLGGAGDEVYVSYTAQ